MWQRTGVCLSLVALVPMLGCRTGTSGFVTQRAPVPPVVRAQSESTNPRPLPPSPVVVPNSDGVTTAGHEVAREPAQPAKRSTIRKVLDTAVAIPAGAAGLVLLPFAVGFIALYGGLHVKP